MKKRLAFISSILFLFLASNFSYAGEEAHVEVFSPQGMVKKVRQVTARFSDQVVSFGDPRLVEPFEIICPEKGHGRWADSKDWVYDFDRDIPAGIICEFALKQDLKTLSGKPFTGQKQFSFSTGGSSIIESYPLEGSHNIDENQIFILKLDAEAQEESVLSHVSCSIEGINEVVRINIIKGEKRERILEQFRQFKDSPHILVQCRQSFPNSANVRLVWGKGIASLTGIKTTGDQALAFKAREPFAAKFRCERENAKADCIPILPMRLDFTAPVPWNVAKKIILKGNSRVYKPEKEASFAEEGEEGESESETPPAHNENFVHGVSFNGPFPENTSFVIEPPKNFKDDAGRSLSNRDKFPLTIRTDAYPPLAKFSARFGIIELKADATLPVTLRNLEPEVKTKMLKVEKGKEGIVDKAKEGLLEKAVKIGEAAGSIMPGSLKGKNQEVVEGLKGRLHKIRMDREEKVIEWLKRIASSGRESTIFKGDSRIKEFAVPKPGGSKAFEVVGIPLKDPGFYVVEMESRILGSSLLGEQKSMFVPTAALITNLSAHFKWGRESSLVWVTSLDKAETVKDASVTIRDCNGKVLWKGKTDENGIARIRKKLPLMKELPYCSINMNYREATPALQHIGGGLFIFAATSKDMTFVHSSWDEGIEPWRYNLPPAEYSGPIIAHTVFDRSLVRAGETVHMKHIIRKHTMSGFSLLTDSELPKTISIQHRGSDQRYEFPLKWDKKGIAETEWRIPKEVKLGHYSVLLLRKASVKPQSRTAVGGYSEGDEEYFQADGWNSGHFRVEEFRVPLMKAIILPPKEPLINAKEAELDLLLAYLSGGGAGSAGVKLRSQIQPKHVHFEDYDGFSFANGEVKEEILKRLRYELHEEESMARKPVIQTKELVLDSNGSIRTRIAELPAVSQPSDILTELEFRDPNGETQTASQRIPLWPSGVIVGIKPDSWASSKDNLKFHVVVLDLSGKPVENRDVKVELFLRKSYSHRKRLVGGYYSYENVRETKKVGQICEGKTDARGLVICETKPSLSGNVILQAKATDDAGNTSLAHRDIWIAGKGEWWFETSDHDRIDLLPEKKRYEPGDTARFQVRMPFRDATALVSVEREGIIETFVKKISGKKPVIEIPIRKNYAPNVFVSALVVRGRVSDIQPTAMVDLGKPAFKLGITEVNVGWKAYELKVNVAPEKDVYKIREKAKIRISVKRANGDLPPVGSEVVIAAVDQGLLELMPNRSWKLIEAMMARRGYEVQTATAQMQVIGKRHYGLKAQHQGGGGGRQMTRELFDTLLLWKARVLLNKKGEADVEFPLNDSLTSFRIVVVANGGAGMFGTGQTSIRSTQDLMILSGIPQVVREGDRFRAVFTIRNASDRKMEVEVKVAMKDPEKKELDPVTVSLSPGEAKEVGWDIKVPIGTASLSYELTAREKGGEAFDRMNVTQKVAEAVPLRTFQATLAQVEDSISIDIEKPSDALPGKGRIHVSLKPRLSDGLGGVTWFMKQYPYTCMEQKISRAVALRDETLWKDVIAELPAHLDSDGLVKYFPSMLQGSDVLTSYIVSIAHEAGWEIPADIKDRMENGLKDFIEGRVIRYGSLPTADLSIRKMAALEALARAGHAGSRLLGPIAINPNLWPTSAVIDWISVLLRLNDISDRERKLKEAEQILRSRINFQGTTMGFSTEGADQLWWLMVSADLNAVKSILTFLHFDSWNLDMPRLVRGALGRQYRGAWNLTTANAWGVLAMEKFSKKFEAIPVSGITSATLNDKTKSIEWSRAPEGKVLNLSWPRGKEKLTIEHKGKGKPWSTVQSLAAIPLKEPFSSGYRIKKTLIPVEQKRERKWSKGDVVRVRLELEAQTDMTWVVVSDPIPAGSSILGTGLGRDSQLLTAGEKRGGWVWPAFEERSFEAFRSYYEFVPKGGWTVEYTIRINNYGTFHLPATRVEALYAPEMLGEMPNKTIEVEH